MPPKSSASKEVKANILTGVGEQISGLLPGFSQETDLSAVLSDVNQLQQLLASFPADATIDNSLSAEVSVLIAAVQTGDKPVSTLGTVLASLYAIQQKLAADIQSWQASNLATESDGNKLEAVLQAIITGTKKILSARPDVEAIMGDLAAIKSLRGGPADAVAFHDFNVLQVAFASVWMNAFDANLRIAVGQLYAEVAKYYDDNGLGEPDYQAISDVESLVAFLDTVASDTAATSTSVPQSIAVAFPGWTGTLYGALSAEQQSDVAHFAAVVESPTSTAEDKAVATTAANLILSQPAGTAGRIATLITEISAAIAGPYSFDVFAPDSFNYGLMITYRQEWDPGEYQAGNLVATIPLAPGEKRSFTKKQVVKRSRAEKELSKSMSTQSNQSTEASRAETEILNKVSASTNFKMTSKGSFNIGIGSIDSTTSFTADQAQQSSMSKKAFHEATIKAAEEYRQERSLEIDTSTSVETDETTSSEISNPNNEITVTYLFYELQRRYKIREFLQRARPVILVAQEVPSPHEIDEAWLLKNQWVISRVLLDDLFRPALAYIANGFAGDQLSADVLKGSWQAQRDLVQKLEAQVSDQQVMRDSIRESLLDTAFKESVAKASELPLGAKIATFDLAPDPGQMAADLLDAQAKAAKTRLQYAEEALADGQKKLTDASAAFTQATKDYTSALSRQYSMQVAIDQLRVHVKENILYYMQALWSFEPADQRFFRLYNKKVICPEVDANCSPTITSAISVGLAERLKGSTFVLDKLPADLTFSNICVPLPGTTAGVGGMEHQLVDVADLDNPLGYKGNYIIFPLVDSCYLTTYMLTSYVNNYLGVIDPDGSDSFDAEGFEVQWTAAQNALSSANAAGNQEAQKQAQAQIDSLKLALTTYISEVRRSTDEIIVPTGQLFIEALPGSQSVLEDFKLEHRYQDVRKVKAEVRHAELENLRLASRLLTGQTKPEYLEDPDIEKKIVVEGNAAVTVGSTP